MAKLLFICSKNQWRSPTAGLLFKNHPIHQAKSAGTSEKARIKVNLKLIDWADIVFVMERKHQQILKQRFGHHIADKSLFVMDIEDHYQFGNEELISILKTLLHDYL